METTLEDILDDDFVDIFKPIFFGQRLLGILNVNLKYKFISSPTKLVKAYCFIAWIYNSVSTVDCVMNCRTQFDTLSTDMPLKLGIFINGFVNGIVVFKSVFLKGPLTAQLFVKLQRIDRNMRMENSLRFNRKIRAVVITSGVTGFMLLVAWIITFNIYLLEEFRLSAVTTTIASTSSYVTIYLIFTIMHFITLRVEYVNNKLTKVTNNENDIKRITCTHDTNDKIPIELVHGTYWILESFASTMEIYQNAIFLFTCEMLAWQLITMQNLVVSLKKEMTVNIPSFLCTMPSSTAYMVLMLTLCLASQSLTQKLGKCEELCTELSLTLEDKSRKNAKDMLLLLKAKCNSDVYVIFTLNAQLPLHLLAFTATYTIVLLQFDVL